MFRHLGLALQALRLVRGKSQAEIAGAAGLGKSQLSKYETGKELPKLDSLAKVLLALESSVIEVMEVAEFLDGRQPRREVKIRTGLLGEEEAGRLSDLCSRCSFFGFGLRGCSLETAELSRALVDPERLVLVAEAEDGDIAGFLCASRQGSLARIDHLVVVRQEIEEWVGVALLEAAFENLERGGALRIGWYVDASWAWCGFIEALGFQVGAPIHWYERQLEGASGGARR